MREESRMGKKNEEYIEAGGACRGALWLRRHRVVKVKGLGYRCKYCNRTLSDIRHEEERKKRK